jgi:hypothetical protein
MPVGQQGVDLTVVERRLGRDVDTADRGRHTGDNEDD